MIKFDAFIACFSKERSRGTPPLIRRNFGHCFVIMRSARGWTCFDPRNSGLVKVHMGAQQQTELAAVYARYGHVVLYGKSALRRRQGRAPKGCVPVCKYLLGIHTWRVQTPYQLYCYLRLHGASEALGQAHPYV